MKKYTILAGQVTGNGSLTFKKGDVVSERQLNGKHIADLLKQGDIAEYAEPKVSTAKKADAGSGAN